MKMKSVHSIVLVIMIQLLVLANVAISQETTAEVSAPPISKTEELSKLDEAKRLQEKGADLLELWNHDQANAPLSKARAICERIKESSQNFEQAQIIKAKVLLNLSSIQRRQWKIAQSDKYSDEAIALVERILEKNPHSIDAKLVKARSFYIKGMGSRKYSKYVDATKFFRNAINVSEEVIEAHKNCRKAYIEKANALCYLGLVQHTRRQNSESEKSFKQAIEACNSAIKCGEEEGEKSDSIYAIKGISSWGMGLFWTSCWHLSKARESFKSAIIECDKAILNSPTCLEALHAKGCALWSLGDLNELHLKDDLAKKKYGESVEVFEKAIEIAPRYTGAYCICMRSLSRLAALQKKSREKKKAISTVKKMLELSDRSIEVAPNDILGYVFRADYLNVSLLRRYFSKSELSFLKGYNASKSLESKITQFPDYPGLYFNLGLGKWSDGIRERKRRKKALLFNESIEYLDRAIALSQEDIWALNLKALVLSYLAEMEFRNNKNNRDSLDHFRAALNCFDQAKTIAPNSGIVLNFESGILSRRAFLLLKKKKYKRSEERLFEALDLCNKAIEMNPSDARTIYLRGTVRKNLAFVQRKLKKRKAANEWLELSKNDKKHARELAPGLSYFRKRKR